MHLRLTARGTAHGTVLGELAVDPSDEWARFSFQFTRLRWFNDYVLCAENPDGTPCGVQLWGWQVEKHPQRRALVASVWLRCVAAARPGSTLVLHPGEGPLIRDRAEMTAG